MLDETRCREIFEAVRKASPADQTEVFLEARRTALTRFANNIIHQNVAEEGIHVSVRAIVDGRTARASTNKTGPDSLKRVAERAAESAGSRVIPNCFPCRGPKNTSRLAASARKRPHLRRMRAPMQSPG
jgi:predicted Zn-dependent protease